MNCKICGAKAHSEYCFKHKPRKALRQTKETKPRSTQLKRKPTGELNLFKEIWEDRQHRSFLSGVLIHNFDVRCFAHVLPKGKYPRYRLNQENIVLLTPEEHSLLDQGTEEQRQKYTERIKKEKNILVDWGIISKLAEELRIEYNEGN